jgi:hypothetical protein
MAAASQCRKRIWTVVLIWLAGLSGMQAQQSSGNGGPPAPVPRVVWFNGSFRPADGLAIAPLETVTLAIYRDQEGGEPLWQETQSVAIGRDGRYDLLLGSATPDGLPIGLFLNGGARWLGVRFNRAGESEQPRVLVTSVPYALKAGDADTLGGRPASAYRLAAPAMPGVPAIADSSTAAQSPSPFAVANTAGTAGHIGKFVDATNLGDSTLFQNGGLLGQGTTAPLDYLHVVFNDPNGNFTGYAVQNTSGGAAAYSGTLFYDQNGALGQFQGFNNSTHEYRINNIAAGGSINLMVGSSSKFFVGNNGNIGIGTTIPNAKLQVAGSVTVDGNIAAKYQDVAEWVETTAPIEAGTVVIVDPTKPNRVLPSHRAYDTRVAGAVSRQPGLILGERSDDKVTVAQSGRVRVKADASYGAIRIGDLLVTSPTPGHAMRSRPMRVGAQALHRPGTVLGKALEELPSGKGEILVLLTLQ